jgi:hypothetical protein
MGSPTKVTIAADNGGTRLGLERRKLIIKDYASEQRSGIERRSGIDRREDQRPRDGMAVERREIFRYSSEEPISICYKSSC